MREIRTATPADLMLLPAIETAADALFAEHFAWVFDDDAPLGAERASSPGLVLVASEEPGGAAIGFAHVLLRGEVPGDEGVPTHSAHLEQVSVLPGAGRRGHGRALVDSAVEAAARAGCTDMTLRTFADVPWNRAFYEGCGFVVTAERGGSFHEGMVAAERRAGLHLLGARVLMVRQL